LSTPQPKVPFWATLLFFIFTLVPGLILCVISIGLVAFFFDRFLFSHDMLVGLAAIGFVLCALWWGWTQIPVYFRHTIHHWLQRNDKENRN